jgi:serine/threonine protein kinase
MFSRIDDIILLNYIDSGCFAEIYLSKKKDSNMLLATKKIGLKYISVEPLFKMHLQNEINFLRGFNHPNIIKLYDVKVTQQDIYLIMEY